MRNHYETVTKAVQNRCETVTKAVQNRHIEGNSRNNKFVN